MSNPVPTPDLDAVKNRQQQTWAAGNYAVFAAPFMIVSETLCEAVDLRAGSRVLDVACGAGNTALAAARRFAEAVGVDYVPALLARGRERAAAERLPVAFQEGDAEALPFPDASFDVVLSTFGVMFAPDQARAAAELLRVCRPGGTIGLANWTPEGFTGQSSAIRNRYAPPGDRGRRPRAPGRRGRRRADRAARLRLPPPVAPGLAGAHADSLRADSADLRGAGRGRAGGVRGRPAGADRPLQPGRRRHRGDPVRVPRGRRHAPLRAGVADWAAGNGPAVGVHQSSEPQPTAHRLHSQLDQLNR